MLVHSPIALAKLVQGERKRSRLNQTQVSSLVGLKQTTLSRFETKPQGTQLETLFRILSALNLEMRIVPKGKASKVWKEEW
jgi:HTH-type transcriptional regulator / antitoxin HipB